MITTKTREITSSDDVIDVRDVIARVEELEAQPTLADDGACYSCGSLDLKEGDETHESDCEVLELQRLTALLEDLEGNGGDEEWRGSWYPITLIHESYFEDYARELANDIGAIDENVGWPTVYIDWKAAADALLIDYTSTEFDGVTYWYR